MSPTEPTDSSEDAFALLAAADTPADLGSLRVRETAVTCSGGRVLWACGLDGTPHVLIPYPSDFNEDLRSAGVQIVRTRLLASGRETEFADLICRRTHLRSLFSIVADEVILAIGREPNHPVQAAVRVLDRWRELLEKPRTTLLGPQALAGLLGELLALEQVWEVTENPTPAVWRGPLGAPHDISDGVHAVEVKTTTVREGFPVEIHGIGQLDPPPNGDLLLRAYRVEPSAATGVTVPDVVGRMLEKSSDRPTLLTLLAAAGYSVDDSAAYANLHFSIRDRRTYLVDAIFPALVASRIIGGLPPSLSSVRYMVDLSGRYPQQLAESIVLDHLKLIGERA